MTQLKKKRIINLEKVLEHISPEERDATRVSVLSAFEDVGSGKMQPQVVIPLPDGSRTCPKCLSALKYPYTMQLPPGIAPGSDAGAASAEGTLVTFFECTTCDQPYMVKAAH